MGWPDDLYRHDPAPMSDSAFADWLEDRFEEKRDAFLKGDMAKNSDILAIIVRAIADRSQPKGADRHD